MVKWWDTELCNRVTDCCVQLHGGCGYMREHALERTWTDGRVQSIFGGTTEIMKEIIGRSLGLNWSSTKPVPLAGRKPGLSRAARPGRRIRDGIPPCGPWSRHRGGHRAPPVPMLSS